MLQCVSQRFTRTRSNDLVVTFFPIVLVLTVHSLLRTAGLQPVVFQAIQVLSVGMLIGVLLLANHFYFRSFCYTLIDIGQEVPRSYLSYPECSLTFERMQNKKSRIYERILRREMLCLLDEGEPYDTQRYGVPERTFVLTAKTANDAKKLYYRKDGVVYCAIFHPDAAQTALLRKWITENNNLKETEEE